MIKIFFSIGLINSIFFLYGLFIALGSSFNSLFMPTLYSGGVVLILSPIIFLVYYLSKRRGYSFSRYEIVAFKVNRTIFLVAILGFVLGMFMGGGMI